MEIFPVRPSLLALFLFLIVSGGDAIAGSEDVPDLRNNNGQQYGRLVYGDEKQAALTVLASELLSRGVREDGVYVTLTTDGQSAVFECVGDSNQSIAACQQRCLAIQAEFDDPGTSSTGGCSSINNGCECTSDPFDD